MKVLFVGHFGARNLGDEVLLYSQMALFRKECGSSFVPYVYSYTVNTDYYKNYPSEVKQVVGFSFKRAFQSLRSILKALKEVDCVIIGGGGIIQDKYFVYRPLSTLLPGVLSLLKNKPVYGFSLGIYSLQFGPNKSLVRRFIEQATHVTYRDDASKLQIKHLLKNKKYSNVSRLPDSALAIPIEENTKNTEHILIAIREVFEEHLNQIVDITQRKLIEYKVNKVKLITFENSHEERKVLNILSSKLSHEKIELEIIDFPSVKYYMHLISKSCFVIGGRLHACIPSFVYSKKLIGLAYESKVSNFCEAHGIGYAKIDDLNKEFLPNQNINQESIRLQSTNELENYVKLIVSEGYKKDKLSAIQKLSWIGHLLLVSATCFVVHALKINYRYKE